MWTKNFQIFKLDLEKAEEPEINICWIIKKASEFQENIYFCFIDYYAKAFDCVDHNKLWKILKETGISDLFHGGSAGKEYACIVGDLSLIPGLGR